MPTPPPAIRRVLYVYGVVGVALWFVPLLSILHVESSAIIAGVSFFAAGLSTIHLSLSGRRQTARLSLTRVVLYQEAALLLPAALLTLSLIWQPNCDYARGALFYAGFPGITVLFAVALASLVVRTRRRRPRTWFVLIGIGLVILPVLYDLGLHPQFYTYNHVFGGVLGPIYDEELAVRSGLVAFRGLTLVWAAALFAGTVLLDPAFSGAARRRARAVLPVAGIVIVLAYAFAPRVGIVTTYDRIASDLDGVYRGDAFEIYYDPARTSDEELRRWIDELAYRSHRLEEALGVAPGEPVRAYIYPDADTKARLTGSRYTSVVPVWLSIPQTHVLASSFHQTIGHELVHVYARSFGLPVLRASLSVGLVEGLAVALEPPDGLPSPHDLVSAALLGGGLGATGVEAGDALAAVVASNLTPWGFWGGRGAVSYTTMGSFVRYLLDAYGAEPFKRAYAASSFESAYGRSPAELAAEWTDHLLALPVVSRAARDVATNRFAVPSLFEKACPHYVPPYRRYMLDAQRTLAEGDTLGAYELASKAVEMEEDYLPGLALWARLGNRVGDAPLVAGRLSASRLVDRSAILQVRYGDAAGMLGRPAEARRAYSAAVELLSPVAHEARSEVALRVALADRPTFLVVLAGGRGGVGRDGGRNVTGRNDTGRNDTGRDDGNDGNDGNDGDDGDGGDGGVGALAEEPQTAAERLAAAQIMLRGHRYEQALDMLRTTNTSAISTGSSYLDAEVARRRLVWLSRASYGARRLSEAAGYADRARDAYLTAGAVAEASVFRDRGDHLRWLAETAADGSGEGRKNMQGDTQ